MRRAAAFLTLIFSAHALWSAPMRPPNVLLVSVDTLRADRLGCYGYAGAATPVIDSLAARGVLFERAYAQAPMTRPSHASILTGLLPFEHGIRDNFSLPLDSSIPTLAQVMKGAGYATAGFPSTVILSSQSGLNRGFDFYLGSFSPGRQSNPEFFSSFQKPAGWTADAGIKWIEQNASQRFFVFLHFYDPHSEYTPPEPYRTKFAGRPYDGEIAYVDAQLGRVIECLDRLKIRENTLIVFCSDHGEGLGEHGEEEHLFFLYNTTLRVPLIINWPGGVPAGRRVSEQVSLVDIMPTVATLAGTTLPRSVSGRDLTPSLQGRALSPQPAYSETLFPRLHFGWSELRSVADNRWKLIKAPRPELYDLDSDPGETNNVYSKRHEEAARLASALELIYKDKDTDAPEAVAAHDAETLEALASLGYTSYTSSARTDAGADPKDKIDEFQGFNTELRSAINAFTAKQYESAAKLLEGLLQKGKSSFEVQYFLGRTYFRMGRIEEAIVRFKDGISRLPAFAPAHTELAVAYLAAKRIDEAQQLMADCVRRDPGNAAFHSHLGFIFKLRGDRENAVREYELARDLAPADAETREALAGVYRDTGRVNEAERELREALRVDPDSDTAWNSLGMLLGASGRDAEAVSCFREAVRLNAVEAYYRFNMGVVLERTSEREEAAREYAEAVRLKPDFTEASIKLQQARGGLISFRLIRTHHRAVAEAIMRKLAAGESFEQLARAYSVDPTRSNGGMIQSVSAASLKPALASVLGRLKAGETSGIVEEGSDFVIVMVVRE